MGAETSDGYSMEHLRVLSVDEGHDEPGRLAAALAGSVAQVEVGRVATILDAEAACGTVDVVVAPADRIDAAWVAARNVCGSAVVATTAPVSADSVPAGVHAVLVLGGDDALAAQAALVWRQLRAGQGRVLRVEDEVSARRESFLGHVSHELRTPLTAVYGTLEILTEALYQDLPRPLQECLEISLRNCASLRRMVDDLLDAASAERGRTRVDPDRVAPAALVRDVVTDTLPKAQEHGSTLVIDVDAALPDVLADAARVRKSLDHLVDNALKFSPQGSDVRIAAALTDDASMVAISVRDGGPGIDPAIAAALFDPLRQSVDELRSSRRGLGLGLYLCKRLAEAHGGRIWAEANPGDGTTFHFTLPCYTLEHLVGALASPGSALAAVTCVAMEVPVPDGAPPRTEATIHLVRSAIRDRDLVATGFPNLGVPDLVGVLAACDEGGAAAIEARLRARLASEQGRSLRAGTRDPRIVRVTVAATADTPSLDTDATAASIGAALERHFEPALAEG